MYILSYMNILSHPILPAPHMYILSHPILPAPHIYTLSHPILSALIHLQAPHSSSSSIVPPDRCTRDVNAVAFLPHRSMSPTAAGSGGWMSEDEFLGSLELAYTGGASGSFACTAEEAAGVQPQCLL